MSFPLKQAESLLQKGFSRRDLGRMASLLSAGAALPFYNEYAMAQDAQQRTLRGGARRAMDPDAVRISSNENPLGPCKEGLEAIAKVAPFGGRYSPFNEQSAFVTAVAEMEGLKESYIAPYAGSSDPLHRVSCAFTSPTCSWTMANPGYGGGAPAFIGSKTTQVALRPDFSHDVQAMVKADPNAGVYYVCNPNNPSGTVTSRQDIEYLLAHKQKDAVVLVDEAYIHFSDTAQPCNDLVAADKDVIVLRTFSKVYGMAGIRAGFAMGRPDLLAKLRPFGAGMLPITGLACATASLQAKNVVAERKAINKRIRENTFEFLAKKNVKFIPSETNFFMMEVNRKGEEFAQAMAAEKIFIGRVWKAWPTKVRVTVGTQAEMDKFKAAYEKITA
ncbi:MAG TPA: pyridoxal phosphate-dependent aminotransferase [Candidatus Sulfopaludibacter sp.]|jgi:histidinol-phosphate aminotransferase|nr:pyridoxal phosphate-dependent aminotransferase [Candidatus Sulfopaludibacter sp.]